MDMNGKLLLEMYVMGLGAQLVQGNLWVEKGEEMKTPPCLCKTKANGERVDCDGFPLWMFMVGCPLHDPECYAPFASKETGGKL